jgi:LPXTG-motif cell wall-anchored protein
VRVDIAYTSTSAENSFTLENIYTEIPTEVDVLKVEKGKETTTRLPDAVFELRKLEDVAPTNPGGTLTYVKENDQVIVTSATTGPNGRLTFDNLTYGVYEIREVTPPPGYIQTEDVTFYLRVDGGVITYVQKGVNKPSEWTAAPNSDGATVYFMEAQPANPDGDPPTAAANATFRVGNTPGAALPNTGGPGTRLFTILGSILILGAGVLLWRRRRTI